jgi:hypothetical protein
MVIRCPNPKCGVTLEVDASNAGKTMNCSTCGQAFHVPPMPTIPAPPVAQNAVPADSVASSDELPHKKYIATVVRGIIVIAVLVLLQSFVDMLPGMDANIGGTHLILWARAGLALAVVVFMLMLLKPCRALAVHYISLATQSKTKNASAEIQEIISSAGLYTVLLLYIVVLYQAVIPFLASLSNLIGGNNALIAMIRVGFAVAGVVMLVKIIKTLKPVMTRVTEQVTERAAQLTAKVDAKTCVCGARVTAGTKFCPSCGKPA